MTMIDGSEQDNMAPVVMAFICGALTGAALAVLFAPARGRDTRDRLLARARDIAQNKNAYVERLQAQLERWSARIDALGDKASHLSAEARAEYEKQLADLRERRDRARQMLGELRVAAEGAWRELATGAERSWQELRRAVDSADAKLS